MQRHYGRADRRPSGSVAAPTPHKHNLPDSYAQRVSHIRSSLLLYSNYCALLNQLAYEQEKQRIENGK